MKKYDQWSSLFWLAVAVFAGVESLRMGIGTVQDPGMGFMAFVVSLSLGFLSVALFLTATFRKRSESSSSAFAGSLWKRVVFVLIAMAIYAKLLFWAGYLVSTFLLMASLFWIVGWQKWWVILSSALLTSLATYYFFSVLLNSDFPQGFLGV